MSPSNTTEPTSISDFGRDMWSYPHRQGGHHRLHLRRDGGRRSPHHRSRQRTRHLEAQRHAAHQHERQGQPGLSQEWLTAAPRGHSSTWRTSLSRSATHTARPPRTWATMTRAWCSTSPTRPRWCVACLAGWPVTCRSVCRGRCWPAPGCDSPRVGATWRWLASTTGAGCESCRLRSASWYGAGLPEVRSPALSAPGSPPPCWPSWPASSSGRVVDVPERLCRPVGQPASRPAG